MYWSIKETAGKDLIFLLIVLNLNLKVIWSTYRATRALIVVIFGIDNYALFM